MSIESTRSVARLMAFASRLEAADVAGHVRALKTLPDDATDHVARAFVTAKTGTSTHHKMVKGRGYLQAGYRDVAGIVLPHIRTLDVDEVQEVLSHPKTIDTLALAALRSTDELGALVRHNYKIDAFKLEDEGFITVAHPDHPMLQTTGEHFCPYAGEAGHPRPVAVFEAFAKHAAEVAYLADQRDSRRALRKIGQKVLPIIFDSPYYGVNGFYEH